LQEEVYGPVNDQQARSLRSIEESGHHLLDLINDILDLAKIDAGKLELDLDLVAIEPICAASLRLVNQAAHKKQITVESRIDPAIISLSADARRLKQILVNLLSNAVKFTPKGGRIGLEVAGDATQQVAHLSVWDTGIGIAQHELERLFQPFVQLDSRLARQYEGTGLGLALVYRMVAMHGGSIAVSSEVGAGSRFTISLPWHAQEQRRNGDTAAELPAANAIGLTAIRTALIIEDSAIAADQLARYLHELGVVTTTRTSGGEGIAQALEAQPDLIISDIMLPDISGWDVLTRLKAEPRTQSIPVVLASVMDDRSQSLALGAAEHLVKPFTRQDIQRLLRRLRPGGASDERAMINPGDANAPVILLVEDNEANIANVTDYLSARGYQVVASRNGVEAIGRAREVRPAVILMDIQMPGMDGLDAMRHIRADANLAAIPIVALTALAMPGDRERCLKAGASDYLSKPVSLQRLAGVVEIYVGHPPLVGRG
ncbi:MAG TPA: response regulator, partial [Roseiflexaceae bacterium]